MLLLRLWRNGSNAICGRQRSTLLPAHPVRSEVQSVPGRSPGSPRDAFRLAFPRTHALSDLEIDEPLAVYSCGGSCGIDSRRTAFPFHRALARTKHGQML